MPPTEMARRATRPSTKWQACSDSAVQIEHVLKSHGVAQINIHQLRRTEIGQDIGKGNFKKVHRGLLTQQNGGELRDVAIMQHKREGSDLNELRILALLAGARLFVPELVGFVEQLEMISVIQECAAHGTLKSAFQSTNLAQQITLQHKLHMAMNVALGVDFLQAMRVVHADLACRNLLLFHIDQDPTSVCVKITDFSLAMVLDESSASEVKKQPQATRWCSPETIASNKYSLQSDIWSLGVTLWELFADGATPWTRFEKRADVIAMLNELFQHSDSTYWSTFGASVDFALPPGSYIDAHKLIIACLKVDEQLRPTPAQLAVRLAEKLQGLLVLESASEVGMRLPESTSEVGIRLLRTRSGSDLSAASADEVSSNASTEASLAPTPIPSKKLLAPPS